MSVQSFKVAVLTVLLLSACGAPQYTSTTPDKKPRKNTAANAEQIAVISPNKQIKAAEKENVSKEPKAAEAAPEQVSGAIAVKGQSLDLHAIVDISGSLKTNDSNCKRFEALKVFFKELKTTLGENADARLSLTVFSSEAKFVGTEEGFLNLSDQEFDAKYKGTICSNSGNTYAAQAFNIAAGKAQELINSSPKKVTSALIFTDGIPNVVSMEVTLQEAAKLRGVFPDRVFGILLKGSLFFGANSKFLVDVTGSADRVREVGQVDDLANALNSFLK
ncbi:MAG: hypothetical protein RLZZ488_1200 [Pseudomonadota bacterium]|jgi:hypothetical protein